MLRVSSSLVPTATNALSNQITEFSLVGSQDWCFYNGRFKELRKCCSSVSFSAWCVKHLPPNESLSRAHFAFNRVFAACRAKNRGLEQAHHVTFSLIPRLMCKRLGMRLGYDIWGKCLGRVSLVIFSRHYLPDVGSTTDQPRNNYFTT